MIRHDKRSLLALLFSLVPLAFLTGQSEITRSVFIPPEYYIGDPVELRLQIELDRYEVLTEPLHFDEPEWVEIRDIEITQDRRVAEIVIRFTSFSPGTRALPDLDFGPFALSNFKIYTKSLVEEGESDLRGLRPQVMIPGSRLMFFLLILAVFVLPYLFYFLIRLMIRSIIMIIGKYHSARPFRALNRTLKRLDAALDKTGVRDIYIALTDSLRIYLTARTGFDCVSATTSEIARLHGFGLDQTLWERMVAVLKQGDMVKFGGETLSRDEMKENLDFVLNLCQEIEKREDFHVNL
ncbi:MAG: hypothetical protein JXR86_09095 [Spirochaetales bacterium]|nr:hypothetical protein [Spirochaetales bacterium]